MTRKKEKASRRGGASDGAKVANGADVKLSHFQMQGAELLKKLQEQADDLDRLAEEYLDKGLLGSHNEALEMRDKAVERIETMRAKLGLPAPAGAGAAAPSVPAAATPQVRVAATPAAPPAAGPGPLASTVPAEKTASKARAEPRAEPSPAIRASAPPEAAAAPYECAGLQSDGTAHGDSVWSSLSRIDADGRLVPTYRWLPAAGGGAVLEISALGGLRDAVDVDVSEQSVRITWGDAEKDWVALLPLPFCTDADQCQIVRRKCKENPGAKLFILSAPLIRELPPVRDVLARQLCGDRGHGHVDSFLAGAEADRLRAHLQALWRGGHFEPGEIEGGDQKEGARARSDEYMYAAADDALIGAFAQRLDRLVLGLAREVPELRRHKLMRGRPMAAVYAGAGSRYTPHFDAVGGDNGRVLTCLLYLNPFWREGDGAELCLWPEARTLTRQGECCEVAPVHGRLVAFLCDSRNLHEVRPVRAGGTSSNRPAPQPRLALSCWYYDSDAIPALAEGQRTSDAPGCCSVEGLD